MLAKTAPLHGAWPNNSDTATKAHTRVARVLSSRAQARDVERQTQQRYRLALLASVEEELFERKVRPPPPLLRRPSAVHSFFTNSPRSPFTHARHHSRSAPGRLPAPPA